MSKQVHCDSIRLVNVPASCLGAAMLLTGEPNVGPPPKVGLLPNNGEPPNVAAPPKAGWGWV